MMRAAVIAAQDIVTRNHLVVALKGDKGQAVSGVKPHELSNWGCILVYWNGPWSVKCLLQQFRAYSRRPRRPKISQP